MPALGKARDQARNVSCLANLRGMATGLQLYMDDGDGNFPYVAPVAADDIDNTNEPSLLDVMFNYIDAPRPVHEVPGDTESLWIVEAPFRCPSDVGGDDPDDPLPTWQTRGTSYDFGPAYFYVGLEIIGGFDFLAEEKERQAARRATTITYQSYAERDVALPVLYDAGYYHGQKTASDGRNTSFLDTHVARYPGDPPPSVLQEIVALAIKLTRGTP